MPPKRARSSKKSDETEGRLLLATQAIKKEQISSIREAARQFDVPESSLRRRLAGVTHRSDTRANNHKLTKVEEESLAKWIISMDTRGAAPRQPHVREMANLLLAERGLSKHQTVGQNWVYNFIKRTPELTTRLSRRYDYRRALCEDPKIISQWFQSVSDTIAQYGIQPSDIYNFDETGFAMGSIASTKVVTRAEYYGKAKLIHPGNREWVTTIECIGASGYISPPVIIFKGKRHLDGWYDNLPRDWRFEISDNGWTTDEIGVRWLRYTFIPAVTNRVGKYCLLILDGHGSHLTPQFDQICQQNDIICLCLPAHSSHLLQPLDIGCFSVLKRAYSKLVENQARCGVNFIEKFDFLMAYPSARRETFKVDTIRNSFAAAGLVPLDAERVLKSLDIHLKTPTPPGSRGSEFSLKTPQNTLQLGKQASSVKALLQRRSQSPTSPTQRALDQIIKGCEIAMHNATFLAHQNELLRNANAKQTLKRARSSKQRVFEEGVSVGEVRDLIMAEQQAPEEQRTEVEDQTKTTLPQRQRAQPKCTNCFIIGHKRTQCPNPPR